MKCFFSKKNVSLNIYQNHLIFFFKSRISMHSRKGIFARWLKQGSPWSSIVRRPAYSPLPSTPRFPTHSVPGKTGFTFYDLSCETPVRKKIIETISRFRLSGDVWGQWSWVRPWLVSQSTWWRGGWQSWGRGSYSKISTKKEDQETQGKAAKDALMVLFGPIWNLFRPFGTT